MTDGVGRYCERICSPLNSLANVQIEWLLLSLALNLIRLVAFRP